MAKQSTDGMNQSGGGNASGGNSKSPKTTGSPAFRSPSDRTTDNNDYKKSK